MEHTSEYAAHLEESEYAAHLEEFTQVLRQITGVVDTLTQIEQQKAQAAATSQHALLDGYLNPEQAEILKLRGLEQKRIRLGGVLGWEGLTFHEIMEQAGPDQRELLSPLFRELDTGIHRLNNAMTSAGRVIGIRLGELEAAITQEIGPGSGGQPGTDHFKDRYV